MFLGGIGIHNFYAERKIAVTQLLIGLIGGIVTFFIATIAVNIWAIVEACTVTVDGQGGTICVTKMPFEPQV